MTPKVRISRLKNELQDNEWTNETYIAADVKNGKQKNVPISKFAKSGETTEAIEGLTQSVQDNAGNILSLQQTKVDKTYVAPSEDADYTNPGDVFFDNDDGKLKKCFIDETSVHTVVETTVANELKQRVSRDELTKDLGSAMTTLQTEEVGNVELLAKKKNGDIVKVDGNDVAKGSDVANDFVKLVAECSSNFATILAYNRRFIGGRTYRFELSADKNVNTTCYLLFTKIDGSADYRSIPLTNWDGTKKNH